MDGRKKRRYKALKFEAGSRKYVFFYKSPADTSLSLGGFLPVMSKRMATKKRKKTFSKRFFNTTIPVRNGVSFFPDWMFFSYAELLGDEGLYQKSVPLGLVFAWNETLWMPVFIVSTVLLLGWLLFTARGRFLQKQRLKLNAETEARILQQQQLISELQFHNDQLKITKQNLDLSISEKDRFISVLVHDLRSPLRYLYKNTTYLFRNWKRDSHAEVDSLITEINNSTQQIHFLTEEMMQWISTQDNTYGVRIREYSLLEISRELEALYKENILHHGNALELEIPAWLKIKTDKLLLKAVMRNLLDNANKNTEHGVIRIQAHQVGPQITLTISDSGVGVSPALLQAINRFFSTSEPMQQLHTQFGHEIIRDFARLLRATVVYEAPERGGLRVLLTLPA